MPQQYIDFAFVKQGANFEAVLSHYGLEPGGTGTERSVLCPFHTETKPSCKIELERKIFQCFGCRAKGNVLEFVALMEGNRADLRGAALRLAAICKIPLAPPRGAAGKYTANVMQDRKGSASPDPPAEPIRAPSEVQASDAGPINPPLAFALKLDPEHAYLTERGLSAEIVADFGLGFCTRGSMAGRICIPIHNERGELVAYAGRWPGDDVPEGAERYKLPAKFQKRRVLFNLHRVPESEHIVLVEGYWSAIRLHVLGLPVAALMGWSVSSEQLELLRDRGVRFVTLLLDGDDAGRRGREAVLPDLAAAFFVRAPLFPDGEKPDTLPEQQLRELVNLNQ
jgi:DNA primase